MGDGELRNPGPLNPVGQLAARELEAGGPLSSSGVFPVFTK